MQSLPEVWKKGIEVNIFDRYTESVVSVVSSTSFSLSNVEPVSRFVTGTLESSVFDKGFKQADGMTVFLYPVIADALSNAAENMTCQMRNTHPGKDEKPQVIGNEVETVLPGVHIPANEGIPRSNLLCGRTKA